jgi:hypothetical protein
MCFVLISKQIVTLAPFGITEVESVHCRLNGMIVMCIVMSALPVTLCSSSVCGTVFKFILRPYYIHLGCS